jgi:transcription elongation factor Elf1
MSLRFDPRLLISGPFKTCPHCGAEEFGILGVGHEMYTRRCRACWFKAHGALPPLSRKVVYIDQFAISDMMKTLNAEHPRHAEAAANPFGVNSSRR